MATKPAPAGWEHPPEFPQLCRSVTERSSQPMLAVEGLTHIVRYANPAFCRLVGAKASTLIGRPFGSAVPEGAANHCAAMLDAVFATGAPAALIEQEHAPGAWVGLPGGSPATHWSYLAWAILPVPLPGAAAGAGAEKPVGVMIQVTDATEVAEFRKQAAAINEALLESSIRQHELMAQTQVLNAELRESDAHEREARLEAQAANRSKDLFLATLSHELRTPLTAIAGWSSILRREGCDAEDLKEGLEVIARNTKAQSQLIDDVLDVSRIVSGKLRLDIRRNDLGGIVSAAIKVVRPAADLKGVRIQAALDPSFADLACDPARIQQIVWNLLANAVKFTPKGGTVRVTLERTDAGAQIRVTDTGAGISPDFLPYVFDRFRQADSSTRRKFGGLGLGLSIVKQLAELHAGTVEAQSEGEGRGATFTVTLPITPVVSGGEDDQADPPTQAPPGPDPDGVNPPRLAVKLDGLRIVVVDDESDTRRLVARLLGDAGAIVTPVATVAQALHAVDQVRPHVLVSDIAMPDEDGHDLIRQLRAKGHSVQTLPAVALTAFAGKGYAQTALLAGFQVHVPKPIDPDELIAVVGSLAGRTGR
jgi:signal transduction histidine kinase/CheY-like chemotaxis protein